MESVRFVSALTDGVEEVPAAEKDLLWSDPGGYLREKLARRLPNAGLLDYNDFLFHIPASLKFLGIKVPSKLERPCSTTNPPLYWTGGLASSVYDRRWGYNATLSEATQEKILALRYPLRELDVAGVLKIVPEVAKSKVQPGSTTPKDFDIQRRQYVRNVRSWVKLRRSAEQVVISAKARQCTGMENVLFNPRTEHWADVTSNDAMLARVNQNEDGRAGEHEDDVSEGGEHGKDGDDEVGFEEEYTGDSGLEQAGVFNTSTHDDGGDLASAVLVDMGFALDMACRALRETGSNVQAAVGWLVANRLEA